MSTIERTGRTIRLREPPVLLAEAAVGSQKERQGPLGKWLHFVFEDAFAGTKTWEAAESAMHQKAVQLALERAGLRETDVDVALAGDLLNQCMSSSFALRQMQIPFAGMFGACSTMALTLGMAAILTACGAAERAIASTSSHFCAAEKQFRMPLEYGGQRAPTAQWTATAAGAAVVARKGDGPRIEAVHFGTVTDYGVKDSANMGAAMAPSACRTIADFLEDLRLKPAQMDLILTGDLGAVGSDLLQNLLRRERDTEIRAVHQDCGCLLYDDTQDVHAGASGCGCSAAVLCAHILRRMREGSLRRVLFAGTGALLSGVSPLQGESIPSVTHAVLLTAQGGTV